MSLLPPPSFNMAAFVLQKSRIRADHTALQVLGGPRLSYAELEQAVRGTATGLLEQGLTPGDRVLMRLDNTPDFPICYLACICAGLIPVPTSAQLTAPELSRIAAETRPALVVAAPGLSLPDQPMRMLSASFLHDLQTRPMADFAFGDPDRPAYIIYTSGTSGQPRAVVHAHRAIWARQMMWQGWYGLTPTDRLLHAGAFNWTYTLGTGLMDPWAVGATALIPAAGTDTTVLPAMIASSEATIFAASPGVYRRILRQDMKPVPALRHGLSAGEKLPAILTERWTAATGTPIYEAYGMTECSTFISGSPARPAPPGTLGYPQPHRRVQLMPDGMIAVHRTDPGLMLGYLDQPGETAAKFSADWFLTGDLGTATADGAIAYAGRADDMMNAGGYRVSPIEVEDALARHPAIRDSAATELRLRPDLSIIGAFYVSTAVIDADELSAHAAAHLAGYKVPRLFVRVDALPRGANNKLLRKVLRQNWETAHGQT